MRDLAKSGEPSPPLRTLIVAPLVLIARAVNPGNNLCVVATTGGAGNCGRCAHGPGTSADAILVPAQAAPAELVERNVRRFINLLHETRIRTRCTKTTLYQLGRIVAYGAVHWQRAYRFRLARLTA